jgi:hypothetical protein
MGGILIGLGIAFFFVDSSSVAQVFCMIFVLGFVIEFEFSLGPIPWLYMAEIMTDKGLSLAVLINWLMTIIMAIVTPFVISGELFIFFGVLCVIVSHLKIKSWFFQLNC